MSVDFEKLDALVSEQAPTVSKELLKAARAGGTEADFRREAARIFEEAGEKAGLSIIPKDEYSVACGYVDSLYNRLILEYKRPGVLKVSKGARPNQAVIQQVRGYINDVAKRERREAHRLAGVATDGFFYIFIRKVGEGWVVDDPMPVNKSSTHLFLRLLFSLSVGAALIPENLLEDFGPGTLRAQRAVRALYSALDDCDHPLVEKLFEQWRDFFSEATDYKKWAERIESKKEFRSFVKGMGLEPKEIEAPKVFFALHTYYSLLIKLVARLAAARFVGGSTTALRKFAALEGDELKEAFEKLEHGGLFREYGIRNFLEGDFFRWYLPAWDENIEKALGRLAQRLAEYDPGTLELAPENARDLLKKLYHYLLPKEIRHDLGEYYTPDWLAERLIRQTLGSADLGNAKKRVLDPACGSGTFLVILIKHIRERAKSKGQDPAETLDLILQNVVGIDLNPLAVIAARTNYLLALGDLLKVLKDRKREIDIPVYQADSILMPSQGRSLFDGNVYPLKTSAGVFRVPAIFATQERMDILADVLDESVEAGVSGDAVLWKIGKAAELDKDELSATKEDLKILYNQLKELHEQGLNGVWARIIKNQFAPLFMDQFHYIVGNPPWINWQHLPGEYRSKSVPIWHHYGMVSEGGLDAILGKIKMDISMLMIYVSVDRYLKQGGKLGFVLPQNLFKTSGAGRRFRRFILPDKTPFGPLVVEDLVKLKPFEGANNRTSVAVFAKGHEVRYPVSYQYWKKQKKGRGNGVHFDTPYEEITKEKITFRSWHAEPVNPADSLSSWITARDKALSPLRKIWGASSYLAREGSNTGGANAVFWVEIIAERPGDAFVVSNITKGMGRKVPKTQAVIESKLLYPLIRGRDIKRWIANPSASIICTKEPGAKEKAIPLFRMEKEFPMAFSYFNKFKKALLARKDSVLSRAIKHGAPFYALGAMSSYTFAPWKIIWSEQSSLFQAAVIGNLDGKPIIPDHKLMLVDFDSEIEAHYLCAALNSAPGTGLIEAYTIEIQRGTHILQNVAVPKFSLNNKTHRKLAELSKEAHKAAAKGNKTEVERIEGDIDELAAELWGLTKPELDEIKLSLKDI